MKKIKFLILLSIAFSLSDSTHPIDKTNPNPSIIIKTQYPLQFSAIKNESPYEINAYIFNNNRIKYPAIMNGISKDAAQIIEIDPNKTQPFEKLYLPYPSDGFMLINLLNAKDPENKTLAFSYLIFNSFGNIIIINPLGNKNREISLQTKDKNNPFVFIPYDKSKENQPLYRAIEHSGNTIENKDKIIIKANEITPKTSEINAELIFEIQGKRFTLATSENNPPKAPITFNKNTIFSIKNESRCLANIQITNNNKTIEKTNSEVSNKINVDLEPKIGTISFKSIQIPHPSQGFMIINLLAKPNSQIKEEGSKENFDATEFTQLKRIYVIYNSNYYIHILDLLADVTKEKKQYLHKLQKFDSESKASSYNSILNNITIKRDKTLEII